LQVLLADWIHAPQGFRQPGGQILKLLHPLIIADAPAAKTILINLLERLRRTRSAIGIKMSPLPYPSPAIGSQ
jgi:hypothetical protein